MWCTVTWNCLQTIRLFRHVIILTYGGLILAELFWMQQLSHAGNSVHFCFSRYFHNTKDIYQ